MAKYQVKNYQGEEPAVPAGFCSWIDYWEKRSQRKASKCQKESCLFQGVFGSPVQLTDGSSDLYIVPLCYQCKSLKQNFIVDGPIVPVNPDAPIKL